MRMSAVKGRRVISVSTADTVGKVSELILDPASSSVAAVRLSKTPDDADIVPWQNLKGFGEDAVTVPGPESLVQSDERITELSEKRHGVMGKRVLTDAGVDLGTVSDVAFDPATGHIDAVVLGSGEIDGDRLRSVGSYAVIVRA